MQMISGAILMHAAAILFAAVLASSTAPDMPPAGMLFAGVLAAAGVVFLIRGMGITKPKPSESAQGSRKDETGGPDSTR